MLQLWKIEKKGSGSLTFADMSSLDAVTRQLPMGLYSTFRTYSRRSQVLGLRYHLQRLYGPARQMGFHPSIPILGLRRELAGLLFDFPAPEARLRVVMSTSSEPGNLFVLIEPLHLLPARVYSKGVKVITFRLHRADPALKATAFIAESLEQRRQVLAESAFEGLMLQNGRILEGLTSNFFYFDGVALGTASRGVLSGVTRRQVLRLAKEQKIPVKFRALPVSSLTHIAEAFLTSSSRGIVPIVEIDKVKVGSGRVGERTCQLMQAYEADIQIRAEKIAA